jgi:hypothetical protein
MPKATSLARRTRRFRRRQACNLSRLRQQTRRAVLPGRGSLKRGPLFTPPLIIVMPSSSSGRRILARRFMMSSSPDGPTPERLLPLATNAILHWDKILSCSERTDNPFALSFCGG